jgi:hypothetical protein
VVGMKKVEEGFRILAWCQHLGLAWQKDLVINSFIEDDIP